MPYGFLDIAVTPAVHAVQQLNGSDQLYSDFKGNRSFNQFTENEAQFIAQRDSFYMATVSETGWPYVQHRGGPIGLLKVLDAKTLAFADYRGNRQYISTGNAMANPKICLFLMDYVNRARLKIYANAEILGLTENPDLAKQVQLTGYRANIERIYRLKLEAFDWNCSQHITPRFTEQQIKDRF